VRADNAGARALYAKRGFVQIAQRVRYYADGEDALILRYS
jgi:ribosomal-protein-alanine N-acetyltransferase